MSLEVPSVKRRILPGFLQNCLERLKPKLFQPIRRPARAFVDDTAHLDRLLALDPFMQRVKARLYKPFVHVRGSRDSSMAGIRGYRFGSTVGRIAFKRDGRDEAESAYATNPF